MVPFSTFVCLQVRGRTNGGSGAELRLGMVDVQVDGAYFLATHVQSRLSQRLLQDHNSL